MSRPARSPDLRRAAALASLAVVAASALSGCGPAGSQPRNGMPPPEVNVTIVAPVALPQTFEYTGQTAGSREVEVRARVAGILQKRNFTEGGRVAQGQSLYGIDPAPFEVALAGAEAALAGAEARLAQTRRNAARLKPLWDARAVSQKEYDDAVSAEQVADAEARAARARIAEARLNLQYTRVEAPVSGIVGRSQRPEGTLVSGPDVLLTSVTQTDPMYVYFGLPDAEQLRIERDIAAGRLQMPKDRRFEVSVKLSDSSVYARAGRLSFSDVRISGSTGTSEARAELPNPEGRLRSGQFVRVTLKGAVRPAAITVPQRAVLEGPKGKFVYVVNEQSQAEPRPVELGDWVEDQWIVNSGLKAGDRVITDGVFKIGPGAPVVIADPNKPKGPPAGQGAKGPADDAKADAKSGPGAADKAGKNQDVRAKG